MRSPTSMRDGTPAVAAFAAEEFATASGVSRYTALSLLADALDLHHRLPRLWAQVELLEVPGWKARRVAELTRKLSAEAAAWFDTQLAIGERYGWKTIERMLAIAVAKFHPELIRDKTGPLSKADWDVRLNHRYGPEGTASGTSRLDVTGDSLDLSRFHDLVCEEAERLKRAGDKDTLNQRKAKRSAPSPKPRTSWTTRATRFSTSSTTVGAGYESSCTPPSTTCSAPTT
ncbi:hypothetical protein ACLM5J_00010 [Nocardioides sp. Bht2]|uniref:hypothetical protein n=1 Tax=Nocardioides sp. Bht2 TaxID=3392297 RepID=UPI0039B5DD62